MKISLHANLQNALLKVLPALIRALLLSLCHLGIYFTHIIQPFDSQKLNLLTNHRRLVPDMQIIMPHVDKLGTASTCRERQ